MLDFNQSLDFMDFVALMRQKHMISTYAFVLSAGAVALTLALGGGGALLLCKRWLRGLAKHWPIFQRAKLNVPFVSVIECLCSKTQMCFCLCFHSQSHNRFG
jgi:hypothetical protein